MKLRTLDMVGVGSFADRMQVDFEALGRAGLFLIEGPTGSGKSTILDAVVFALYGSTAGRDTDAGRLNSHLRTASPYVELEFEVGGATYRVRRSPAHARAKKRGDGSTEQKAQASLMRVTAEGAETLATRASEVAEQVARIVGLTKQQFVSTVVLAQGEFATFLDADSGDRAQILERVFGTEFYQQVEDQLASMRRSARQQVVEARQQVLEVAQQCAGILDVEIADDEPAVAIDAALTSLRADCGRAQKDAADARKHLEVARTELARGEELYQRQGKKREHMTRREQLLDAKSEIDAWEASVTGHERALPVVEAIKDRRDAQVLLQEARTRVADAEEVLASHGEPAESGQGRLQEIAETLGRLQVAVSAEADLPALRSVAQSARTRADELAEQSRQDVLAVQGVEAALAEVEAQLTTCPEVHDRLAEVQRALDDLEQRAGRRTKIDEKQAQRLLAQGRLEAAQRAFDAAESAVALALEHVRRDRAAELAADLVEGQPCRVCGSVQHPDPATVPAGEGADVSAVREALDVASRDLRSATSAVEKIDAVLAEYEQAGVPGSLTDLDNERDELSREHDALTEAVERRRGLLTRREEHLTGLRQTTDTAAASTLSAQSAESTAVADADTVSEKERLVEAELAGYPSVGQRCAALDAVRGALADVLAARQDEVVGAQAEAQSERSVARALEQAGFPDAGSAEAAVLAPEECERRRREVAGWKRDLTEVDGVLRELDGVDLDVDVDLEGLRAHTASAGQVDEAAHSEVATLSDRLAKAEPRRSDLADRMCHHAEVKQRTAGVIRMADLATAQRQEVTHRIRLSSFVLMRRFEDVVNAANDRLDTISEGRYQLSVEHHGLDARAQAGLDLRVYDARSDSRRSTKSLSGGERFYVSLALALGLADVVRGESGGAELGTLFIDEGFGSLDAEVLEEVMDMLEQVRVGEDRVIGLISHVDALKQRIDPRISVRRDPRRPGVSTLEVRV